MKSGRGLPRLDRRNEADDVRRALRAYLAGHGPGRRAMSSAGGSDRRADRADRDQGRQSALCPRHRRRSPPQPEAAREAGAAIVHIHVRDEQRPADRRPRHRDAGPSA